MRTWTMSLLMTAALFAGAAERSQVVPHAIEAAIHHPDRPAEDKARDADRRPGQVLAFYGVQPGMKVADLMAGGGYYTELLSRIVGEEGKVYAQNNRISTGPYGKAMTQRLKDDRLPNVVRLDRELEDLGLPAGGLDAIFLVLFYHDTYWMKVDREKMNQQVMAALKPGGIYAVIDHHAAPASGDRDVKTLHRVDAQLVSREILDAGFEFVGESDVLHNPADDRTINVFDPSIRGRTDQFIFKFRKPK
jgi:predicted methyltransferase